MSTLRKMHSGSKRPATGNDIRAIVGPLEDDIVAAILRTEATPAEIQQALDWLEESRYTLSATTRRMNEPVRRVYEILDYADNGYADNGFGWR